MGQLCVPGEVGPGVLQAVRVARLLRLGHRCVKAHVALRVRHSTAGPSELGCRAGGGEIERVGWARAVRTTTLYVAQRGDIVSCFPLAWFHSIVMINRATTPITL